MNDDLDIRGGGVVAVDTATLRDAALGFAQLGAELGDVSALVGSAASEMIDADLEGVAWRMSKLRDRIGEAATQAEALDAGLRHAAAVYEAIEAGARLSIARAEDDRGAMVVLTTRLATLEAAYPGVTLAAAALADWQRFLAPSELTTQVATGSWWMGPNAGLLTGAATFALAQVVSAFGAGRLARGDRLRPAPSEFRLDALRASDRAHAPASLAAAAERMPGTGEARIRVERYSMPDGTRQFVVYVAGMQSPGLGGGEAFDMLSNTQLYSGQRSTSYDATLAALRESGAEPGDVVHAFGQSQGAMIAAHIALESEYDTRTLVSFGSPVEADVGPATLSVSLRHTDDPVAALEGGGHGYPVGAPGSFVAERTADPRTGVHDLLFPAHVMPAYTETAKVLDASTDPRMDAVRDVFAGLGAAASVRSVEYAVERLSASSSAADAE